MIINPIDPFKVSIKRYIWKNITQIRSFGRRHMGQHVLDNIYLATTQKAGSQWFGAIFRDKRIRNYTNLLVYPQHHYDTNEFHMRFPLGTVIPGLYINYQKYKFIIHKPPKYKTIYIYRDPRDIVVSWYYSVLESHGATTLIEQNRRILKNMSKKDGLIYAIKFLNFKFTDIRSWVEMGNADEHVMIIKFEDITKHVVRNLAYIFEYLGIDIPISVIENVSKDYTKNMMRHRDIMHRKNKSISHYREVASDHRDEFESEHYDLFTASTGNLLSLLNYE